MLFNYFSNNITTQLFRYKMGKGEGNGEGWGEGEGRGSGQGEWKSGLFSSCDFSPMCKQQ